VLAQLAKVHAHAVFCMVGNNAIKRPTDVRAEAAAADPLCDHSRDHSRVVASKNRRWVSAEVDDGLREISSVDGGVKVAFYRQPYGLWTRVVVAAMYSAGLDPLRWTDDPRDWSRPGAIAIAQRVLLRLRPGAIVLMHDGGGDRSETVDALGWLLPHLAAAGWRFGLPVPQRLSPGEASRPQ
jgi:peptidoglycan-N-acetylglucosamine deacetylase